jgi:two-component system osmolarity sensor histidine kinase EnvZ
VRGAQAVPGTPRVAVSVPLIAGPPPPDADALLMYPRFRLLAVELRRLGVPVRELRISGRTGEAITWLELELSAAVAGGAGAGPAPPSSLWVGVRGEFEGVDVRGRTLAGFFAVLLAIGAGAWWLSRRILRPVDELRQAMRRFAAGERIADPPPAPKAPAELRELAEQFARLARQRAELDDERRTMLAAISHDLRSPLTRIRMAAALLPEGGEIAPRRDAIVRNVHVADRLLGSFIDFARTEHEAFEQPVDLAALVQRLTEEESDLLLLRPAPGQVLVVDAAHPLALERALRNLVDNARRHGAAPIEVSLARQGRTAVLAVRDHGPGIAPALRETLLRPFARGERSRGAPGTGLGLAIVQRVAERCGGRLALTDAQPGLCAQLELPLSA